MEKLETLLVEWRSTTPQHVPTGSVKSSTAFQPRDTRLAPYADRTRLEAESERHVADLARALSGGRELDPLLVARIGGTLTVVDGHHRLKAYHREQRATIPVCIMDTTERMALLVSKLANCDGAKLPMHDEQRRECLWQYLAAATLQGRRVLPDGLSLRKLADRFGPSHATVSAMLKRLPQVTQSDYSEDACDPGTGFPRWMYVKGNAFRDAYADMPQEQQERHRDERRAAKIAAIIGRDGLAAFLRSLRLLELEAVDQAAESLAAAHAGEAGGDY